MNTLIYSPDQSSYSITDSANRLSSDVGPIGAFRRNLINGIWQVDVTWQASKEMYTYLAQVYRAFVKSGGNPFNCAMFLDKANVLETFQCRFVHGSFGLTAVNGETYSVKAQLNVTPKPYDLDILPFANPNDLIKIKLSVDTGAYVIFGSSVNFRVSSIHMPATVGVYLLSGQDAKLVGPGLNLGAEAGDYALTGVDAAFTVVPAPGVISAETGAYTLTGNSATLTKNDVALPNGIMVMQDGIIITRVINAGTHITVTNDDGHDGDIEIAVTPGSFIEPE